MHVVLQSNRAAARRAAAAAALSCSSSARMVLAARAWSRGSMSEPCSPTISGNAPHRLATTGTPGVIASKAGRQNVSRHDMVTNKVAAS